MRDIGIMIMRKKWYPAIAEQSLLRMKKNSLRCINIIPVTNLATTGVVKLLCCYCRECNEAIRAPWDHKIMAFAIEDQNQNFR